MTESTNNNTSTVFKTHLMTLTGCNEATAQYVQVAAQGSFAKLREVNLTSLSKPQRRKIDSLVAAILSIAQEHALTVTHINASHQCYDLMYGRMQGLIHEEVWCIYMGQSGKVLHLEQISKGGMTGAIVDVKIILRAAIHCGATRMILVHNHPSGNVRPSQQDINLTNKIRHASQLHDIQLTDHIIIADERYYSFLDEGMMGMD